MIDKEVIMEEIRKLAKELTEITDEKQIILLINKINSLKYKINSLKYKIMNTTKEKYTYNELDFVGRYGT